MLSVEQYVQRTPDPTLLVVVGFFSSMVFIVLLTTAMPGLSHTAWSSLPTFTVTASETTHALSLLDFVAVLASDFLALAIMVLPLPVFHRAYHHLGLGMRVKRVLAYVTYEIEPKLKTVEAMLMYLA